MKTSADHSRPSPSGSNIPINSWYPPSVLGPASSLPHSSSEVASPSRVPSRTNTSNPGTSSQLQHSHSNVGAVANMFPMLKDKSVEELRKLLSDKEAYRQFLHTFDDVQQLDHLRIDLKKNNLDLARKNLEKESEINQLNNQCMIIRTTELASTQEKFQELHKQEMEVKDRFSISALLNRLQGSINEADEDSENTHRRLLSGELELGEFIQMYKKQRILYHRRTLVHLAAVAPG
ncbi:hypothetical protein O6H91_12G058000 [Diphasiastrum complanatum]|uniref:Uncharacterized protein n=1 Tax=Diphasiastrum complanatum TaxID=34168 RepID=A0ACC2C2A0_DIPCM|nr:hypothetical protein O6H91_12G058000 [Diphasiastrum complanatum]